MIRTSLTYILEPVDTEPGECAFLPCTASKPRCTSRPGPVESVCMSPALPGYPAGLPVKIKPKIQN